MRFFTFQRSYDIHHLLHQFYEILAAKQSTTRSSWRRASINSQGGKCRLHQKCSNEVNFFDSKNSLRWHLRSLFHHGDHFCWCTECINQPGILFSMLTTKSTNHKVDRLDECINVSIKSQSLGLQVIMILVDGAEYFVILYRSLNKKFILGNPQRLHKLLVNAKSPNWSLNSLKSMDCAIRSKRRSTSNHQRMAHLKYIQRCCRKLFVVEPHS